MIVNLERAIGLLTAFCFAWLALPSLKADVVILQSGSVLHGNVLQQDGGSVLMQMDYGTVRYPASMVKDVQKEKPAPAAQTGLRRIPAWGTIISVLATNGWAHEIKQIPATVVDNGILKDVPYISFRCNTGGYEINIYGDLDKPAGIEIGAINYLVKSEEAKSNCVSFISTLLDYGDAYAVRSLNVHQKDSKKMDGFSFETTFPDEPDSYGGWWISVYDENALVKARASGAELLAITQPRVPPKPQAVAFVPEPATTPYPDASAWSPADISNSRPASPSNFGGDRVYVRGYTRSDGTYVHSYTRSAPHHR